MSIHAKKVLIGALSCLLALCALPALAVEDASQVSQPIPAENTSTVSQVWAAASDVEREHWRKSVAATPRPTKGCFQAHYPDIQWRPVPCDYRPRKIRLPSEGTGVRVETVGDSSGDMMAQVTGGITQAEGSFDSVSTTGETDSAAGAGKYSLQLNTEFFNTSLCTGAGANCQGWAQFIYDDDGSTSIQYWMIKIGAPGTSCPTPHHVGTCAANSVYTDGWCPFTLGSPAFGYCAVNSPVAHASAVAPTALASVVLQGNAHVGAVSESVTATVSGTATTATGGNYFPDLGTNWHEAEFNVFGACCSSVANFDANTTLVVRVGVDSGVSVGPGCDFRSYTAETNNLSIIGTTSTPPHNGHPSLVFTESNSGTPNPSCSAGVSIGDTHITTFDGVHYDFQASGDYLLAEVANEFTVQARQASGAPQWPNAAVNKALAVQMGKTRVAFYVEPSRMEVDGAGHAIDDGQTLMLKDGVQIRRQGNMYTASDKHGNRVRAVLYRNWLDAAVLVGHAPSRVLGLLGNPAGDGTSLETSTGARMAAPIAFSDLYGIFASSWRVPPAQSLFAGEERVKFGIPARPFFAHNLPPEAAARARALCQREGVKDEYLIEDCTLDTVVLNNKAAARAFIAGPTRVRTVIKPAFVEPRACDKACERD
jgi:hypothetical protein